MKLHVEVSGSGPDIVFLHGWGMNNAVWSSVEKQLSKNYRITLIELPGHGESDYDPTKAHLDDWVNACLDAAPNRAIWVGWSLGGLLAQRVALISPDRVSRLVLVASSPRFVATSGWSGMAEKTFHQFADSLSSDAHLALGRFLSLQVQGDDAARQTLRELRQDLVLKPEPNPIAMKDGLALLLNADLRASLKQMSCPVLWLLGERDTLVPVDLGESLEELISSAEILILPGCAHAPFLSHPDVSLRALTRFLGSEN